MVTNKEYIVLNPRGIMAGIHILSNGDKKWYEGDAFVRPLSMTAETLKAYIDRGFLEEKE